MIVFAIVMGLLLCIALFMMMRVVFGTAASQRVDHERMNIEMARDELSALKLSRDAGQIDQDSFDSASQELELRLAETLQSGGISESVTEGVEEPKAGQQKWLAFVLAPFIVIFASWMYLEIGDQRALDKEFVTSMMPPAQIAAQQAAQQATQQATQQSGQSASSGNSAQDDKLPSIDELLPRLEAHLETTPTDVKGWRLLGTTYLRLRRFTDADSALSKANSLEPGDLNTILQLADTKAMLAEGEMAGQPIALVDEALELDPDDVRAIWLKGMASQQLGDSDDAIRRWKQLIPRLSGDPGAQVRLREMIVEAGGELDAASGTPEVMASDSSTANTNDNSGSGETSNESRGANTAGVNVSVTLDPTLQSELDKTLADVESKDPYVFIYARAANGPPMPLAVSRQQLSALPLTVTLDDSMAMMPQLKISAFDQLTVGARISFSGDPIAQPGDLFGEVTNVNQKGTSSVQVTINSIKGSP